MRKPKRNTYEIEKAVLSFLLKDSPLTASELERKVNTNPTSVRSAAEKLHIYGLVHKKHFLKHPSNRKPFDEFSITDKGKDALKNMK